MENKIKDLKIILCARDQDLFDAWQEHCSKLDNVSIVKVDILSLQADAIVSPANSYGYMDGGIDLLYCLKFGFDIQTRLQKDIKEKYNGELVVGNAHVIETNYEQIPALISAPTMRVPMILPADTINPYLAMRAALLATQEGYWLHDADFKSSIKMEIKSVIFPGLGTGVGKVDPHTCAKQMKQAIVDLVSPTFPIYWQEAVAFHNSLLKE